MSGRPRQFGLGLPAGLDLRLMVTWRAGCHRVDHCNSVGPGAAGGHARTRACHHFSADSGRQFDVDQGVLLEVGDCPAYRAQGDHRLAQFGGDHPGVGRDGERRQVALDDLKESGRTPLPPRRPGRSRRCRRPCRWPRRCGRSAPRAGGSPRRPAGRRAPRPRTPAPPTSPRRGGWIFRGMVTRPPSGG